VDYAKYSVYPYFLPQPANGKKAVTSWKPDLHLTVLFPVALLSCKKKIQNTTAKSLPFSPPLPPLLRFMGRSKCRNNANYENIYKQNSKSHSGEL
jgi:hypothetical protein